MQEAESGVKAIAGNIDVMAELVQKRTAWVKMLDQVNCSLPEGMWLTSVSAVKEAPAGGADEVVTAIELAGLGYRDKVESGEVIREFRDALRAMPFFLG